MRTFTGLLAIAATVLMIGACTSTWQGVKQDTRENTRAVGQGVQDVGKKIEKQTE
ncbi:hypothetical protein [Defluviicoccus vanus]|uniref:Entericidin EcnAB n=1 Tax=Defluviicoccus vanus TaxID=111831 RepID=A0A7H1MXE5_9PROT|nr:hypothetical protein [Defluviicoccus vanus]QNT68131.1 hypothetical protein HQ394_00600 [Defluviicoccus vanus]